jgi:hypothetical protein
MKAMIRKITISGHQEISFSKASGNEFISLVKSQVIFYLALWPMKNFPEALLSKKDARVFGVLMYNAVEVMDDQLTGRITPTKSLV